MAFDAKTTARHDAIKSGKYEFSFGGGYEAGWDAATTVALAAIAKQIATYRSENEEGWPVTDLQIVAEALNRNAEPGSEPTA